MIQFDEHQSKLFTAITDTEYHICVQATAGAGKTTVILEALNYVPKFKRTIFLSFSNAIVKELKSRVPVGIKAATLHSHGFSLLIRAYGELKLEENKYFKSALFTFYNDKATRTKENLRDCFRIQEICNFYRMTLCEHDEEKLMEVCEYYGLDWNVDLVMKALELLKTAKEVYDEIDFTDMIYLPIVNPHIINGKYDYVFVDEAQDMNSCQEAFVNLLLADKGRRILIGDKFQSIYSFMGSKVDVFESFQKQPNTITLTFPTSYRCPKEVVKRAQRVCDTIITHENAKDGLFVEASSIDDIREGDMVVSRITRPLIELFFILLDRGVKANIVGKEIEKGLIQFSELVQAYDRDIVLQNLTKQLKHTFDELTEIGFKKPKEHQKYIAMEEKCEVIRLILRKCSTGMELVSKIKDIFREDKKSVKLMTIHKSKGLEAERVFLIYKYEGEKLLPFRAATKPWELVQETNLEFVGVTRSKSELHFLEIA